MKTAIIILAAGSSTRMKTPKQLLDYKGKNLLQRTLDLATELGAEQRLLVLGGWRENIKEQIDASTFDILHNTDHKNGMSTSLKLAINHIRSTSKIESILVMLCDQPLIPKSHYEQLLKQANQSAVSIVATSYNQILGVPCIFKSNHFEELLNLDGQQGAKFLIKKYKNEVISIPCKNAAFDIDTLEDYHRLLRED